MAYLVLIICAVYSLLWAAGLAFSFRSDGPKAIWIPAMGLLLFLGGTASSAISVQRAISNPPQLTAENYLSLKNAMTPDQVTAVLGTPLPDERAEKIDLGAFSITYPREVTSRLRGGGLRAEARDAKMVLRIEGEPSRANLRRGEGLGAPVGEERNGLMGLEITLTENGNTAVFKEGEHWNYEDDMTAEDVAKKLGEIIDEHPSWVAEGSPEKAPETIILTPELEDNKGSGCNDVCTAQVTSEPTTSFIVRSDDKGKEQKFRGGEDEAYVQFWLEKGILMDADFSTADKLIIGGYIDDKLVGVSQGGLPIAGDVPNPVSLPEDEKEDK